MPDKYIGSTPTLVGKDWPQAAIELHDFIRKLNFAHNLQIDLDAVSISGGNTTGSLTPISSGTIYFSASNNLTLSQSGQSIGVIGPTLISVGMSTGGNTAGTTGLVASRLVLYGGSNVSLSQSVSGQSATLTWNVHPPIGLAAGSQTATTGTVIFSNANNVTFGMSGSNTITASVAPQTGISAVSAGVGQVTSGTLSIADSNGVSFGIAGQTLTATVKTDYLTTNSFFQHPVAPFRDTVPLTFGGSSLFVMPCVIPDHVSAGYLRIPISAGATGFTVDTVADRSETYGQSITDWCALLSQGVGASSRSLQTVISTSGTGALQLLYNVGAASNNQSCSLALTYNVTGSAGATFSTSYSLNSTSAVLFTSALTAFLGNRFIDIPLATLVQPNNYWFAFGQATSEFTSASGAVGVGLLLSGTRGSVVAVSQMTNIFNEMGGDTTVGSQMIQGFGHGWWTTNSNGATTGSMALSHISTISSQPLMLFQLIRHA